ncbi:hypothetical protein ES702_05162 [subsurface metagenome]
MIADAIHSMSDCLATGTVYVGLRIGEEPPDGSHPYGHANAETIVAFLVAPVAKAWDHPSDVYSSVAALAGTIGARLAF